MYKIVGTDQNEYGPISCEKLIRWIKEGRANRQIIAALDDGPWKAHSTFSEFASTLGLASSPSFRLGTRWQLASSPKTNAFTVLGLVLAILGFFQSCAPVFAAIGLVFSCIALVQIGRSPSTQHTKSIAIAAVVIRAARLLMFVILLIMGFFHNLLCYLPEFP